MYKPKIKGERGHKDRAGWKKRRIDRGVALVTGLTRVKPTDPPFKKMSTIIPQWV
jgi:hypothetical protein